MPAMPSEREMGQKEGKGLGKRMVSSYFTLSFPQSSKPESACSPDPSPETVKEKKGADSDIPTCKDSPGVQKLVAVKSDSSRTQNQLPLPASTPKRARIDSGNAPRGLKVHWARFIKRINGPGSGSNVSESLLEHGESTDTSGSYVNHRRLRQCGTSNVADDGEKEQNEVEQIVVDNVLMHSGQPGSESATPSDRHTNPEADHSGHTETHTQTTTQHEETFWEKFWPWRFLRWRLIPAIREFLFLQYADPAAERHFLRESWYNNKNLALWGTAFNIINWSLTMGIVRRPLNLPDKIFFYGLSILPIFALPFMVIYDFPYKRSLIYQCVLTYVTWMYGWYAIINVRICGFFDRSEMIVNCHGKNFVGIFYSLIAVPAIAFITLRMSRLAGLFGAFIGFALQVGLVIINNRSWYRNLLNYTAFHAFLIYANYKRETSERRLYSLRDQLKVQFTATQKAQVAERKAADSKRRLTSYIFHEVRVPLNTALLAVQNMEAVGLFGKGNERDIEFTALEGSLSMMSKVLNDVLDFNRLDAGKFESISKPYNFHNVVRSMLGPLSLAATARGLTLETELDESIDLVASKCYYTAKGYSPQEVMDKLMIEGTSTMAYVLGDEVRLRQVITNLTSNATKFTHEGGRIKVVTKLLWPKLPHSRASSQRGASGPKIPLQTINGVDGSGKLASNNRNVEGIGENSPLAFTEDRLHAHDLAVGNFEDVVIRIEVHDTGVGIKPKDLKDHKLFSPYVQTEIGRSQGGKGTGLGLALIRRIVKLSGGRLGVKSKIGVGSTFWVEFSMGVGKAIVEEETRSGGFPGTTNYIHDDLQNPLHSFPFQPGTPSPQHNSPSLPQTPAASLDLGSGSGSGSATECDGYITFTAENAEAFKRLMDRKDPMRLMLPPSRSSRRALSSPLASDDGHFPPTTSTGPGPEISSVPPMVCTCAANSRATVPPLTILPEILVHPHPVPVSSGFGTPDSPTPKLIPTPTQSSTPPSATDTRTKPGNRSQVIASTPSSSSLSSSSPWISPEKSLRCLVVDDDGLTRKLMSRLLRRLGCSVDTAANGQCAVEMIVASSEAMASPVGYDVVFLDNQMPVMSGLEAVGQLRDAGREDFVVGVTGNALVSDQDEYLAAGVNHILTKPVLERSLKAMLTIADQQRSKRMNNTR